ncbi:hypothetical protein LR48_Vigan06g047600 [Vigna angularis]|uniref:Uncharacterized protein n=1 Tax=Phaseolus angularis TaxID=3914 RepID=A0A0L9UQJ6_PHAAN|nr:hypothetical protein LR48_Vigan06g047600 [Vigna angularis]
MSLPYPFICFLSPFSFGFRGATVRGVCGGHSTVQRCGGTAVRQCVRWSLVLRFCVLGLREVQLQKAFITGVPKLNQVELETVCEDFSNIINTFLEKIWDS